MKIIIDGRKVGGESYLASYEKNMACFRPRALNRRVVLHEFYHHLVYCKKIKMKNAEEEKQANHFVIQFLNKA